MNAFSLTTLLRSENFHLITNESGRRNATGRVEMLLWEDPNGPLKIYRVTLGGAHFHCLRLGEEISVDVTAGNELAVSPGSGTPQITIDHFLADQIFPRVLSQRDELVVHAGAVRHDTSALLLLGASGSGKSTLATSFHQTGATLMGDDAVFLSVSEGSATARALYASLRLFPDSIDALFSSAVTTRDMAHYSSKQRVDLNVGQQKPVPVPVRAIFVLGRDKPIAIRRLSVAQACMTIVENSFALDPSDRERARQRLERASQLAHAVPVHSLSYPRDFGYLPQVREAIMSAVADDQLVRY